MLAEPAEFTAHDLANIISKTTQNSHPGSLTQADGRSG